MRLPGRAIPEVEKPVLMGVSGDERQYFQLWSSKVPSRRPCMQFYVTPQGA